MNIKILNFCIQNKFKCRKIKRPYSVLALLSGISGLVFALGLSTANAQAVIDGGTTWTQTGGAPEWSVGGNLTVGQSGIGILVIVDGGVVSNTIVGYIGYESTGSGSVKVTGTGSQWNMTGNVYVGNTGTGTLDILDGGMVSNSSGRIGGNLGSSGTVKVSGTGSHWKNGTLFIGYGIDSTGRLIVEDGGLVTSGGASAVGLYAGSNGVITVTGAGSEWTHNNGSIAIGENGSGTLTISAGGIVSNTGTAGYGMAMIGLNSDSNGSVTVTGAGSQWNNSGSLTVGNNGTGTLKIENGGVVWNASHADIGLGVGSNGSVTVSGTESEWNNGSELIVGDRGTGRLTIQDGGKVSNTSYANIGFAGDSIGTVTVTGAGSEWNNNSEVIVGRYGTGTLTIENGGVVSNGDYVNIALFAGSIGRAKVSGSGSQWNTWNELIVGRRGEAWLTIENGGVVSSPFGYVGNDVGSKGIALVTGPGSRWDLSSLYIGQSGTGYLTIADGGVVSNIANSRIGVNAGSNGTVIVRGGGSTWDNNLHLYIGDKGTGSLTILEGGQVLVAGTSSIGAEDSAARGSVTVAGDGSKWMIGDLLLVGNFGYGDLTIADGGVVSSGSSAIGSFAGANGIVVVIGVGSQWTSSGALNVGYGGVGEITVADGGRVSATNVMLARDAASTGTLNIGAADGQAPVAPGVLNAQSVTFGPGEAKLVFNHTSSRYVFDATINNGADNAAGSGTGLVGDGLIEAVSGRTIINAYHGDFTGTFQIRDGGILQINHDTSHTSTLLLPGGRLEGHGVVSSLVNEGTVAPGGSIGTLTVAGNYTGSGGELHIETVLGDDSSPTDRLVITGDVSGTTPVVVTNLGGDGAESADGIKIIEIGGVSPGNAFTLKGDYVAQDGQQVVVGGAYAYSLRYNSEADPSDGHWYLTSKIPLMDPETGEIEEGPRYQAGVPLYEQYPQVLAALNTVPTLQQRVGNRGWVNNNAVAAAPGNTPGTYGLWGRIEGTRTASDPARSTSMAHRDTDLWKLQTGFDFGLHQGADGSQLIGGVNVSHGTALAEIASPYGRGKVDTTGTGIGATLTWYGSHGFYVDGQAQVMWFDTDITSTTEGRKDVKGNNDHGYVLSAETGNRYQLGNGFSVTPQVQLVYSRVDFDSFTDPFNARVSLNDGDSLRGRFGVSLDHEAGWIAQDGTKSRSHVYGIANLYNEFLDGPKVSVDTVRFVTRDERVWAGIGVGGTYEWANGAYAFYGNANIAGSVEHMSDNYAFGGTLGFRARW